MSAPGARHVPVLLRESLEALRASEGGMFLDCTFGGGGHTEAILESSPDAWVVALDRDARAIERGQSLVAKYGDRLTLIHAPFSHARQAAAELRFDGILADLGMSTDQLHEERGFSFGDDAPLDMRMDEGEGESAGDFVNNAPERDIYIALAQGGVGKQARIIARMIASRRPFQTAKELGDAIKMSSYGKRGESRSHPATVVFQALRMFVNREREEIEALMNAASDLAKPGGRLAVITFHSIEDQLVAGTMRRWESAGSYPASWRGPRDERAIGAAISKKPIVPSDEEVDRNAASRSARLRVFEFSRELISK